MNDGVERSFNWKAFAWLGLGLLIFSWVGFVGALLSDRGTLKQMEVSNKTLIAENAKLRETADSYYRAGLDLQKSGDLIGAVNAYSAILTRFPTSNLVKEAGQRINGLNIAMRAKLREELVEQRELVRISNMTTCM